MKKLILSLILYVPATVSVSFAQDLVLSFDFDGEEGDQTSTTASQAATEISGGIVERGSGLIASGAGDTFSSRGWDGSPDDNKYVSFSFSVEQGHSLDLEELSIRTRSSNTGPGELGLRYNKDSFDQNLHTFSQSGGDELDSTINLSSLPTLAGEVEFRIYALNDMRADGDPGIGSTGTYQIRNFEGSSPTSFTGTVIPEPSAYAAICGGVALAVLAYRRRSGAET